MIEIYNAELGVMTARIVKTTEYLYPLQRSPISQLYTLNWSDATVNACVAFTMHLISWLQLSNAVRWVDGMGGVLEEGVAEGSLSSKWGRSHQHRRDVISKHVIWLLISWGFNRLREYYTHFLLIMRQKFFFFVRFSLIFCYS